MDWNFFDHNVWQTIIAVVAVLAAYLVGTKQIKISDAVELYCSLLFVKTQNGDSEKSVPHIHIQNVGTRLIYLDKYIFNGREYMADSQILPSTYSQAQNSFYRVQLPTNGEEHVSMEVFYHDLDHRFWSSKIIAKSGGPFGWDIKTLPRKKVEKSDPRV